MSHKLRGVRTLTSVSVLSFKEGTDCSLYFIFQDFSFFNVFSHWSPCSCPHLCECVWVTVVVRSQVVVLVLRGSVVEETRCPYQEAGWTGNPAEATNVIVETYLTRVWTLQCEYKMYQCNAVSKKQKGEGTTNHYWQMKKARKSDGCLIRTKQEIKIQAARGNFICWCVFNPQTL